GATSAGKRCAPRSSRRPAAMSRRCCRSCCARPRFSTARCRWVRSSRRPRPSQSCRVLSTGWWTTIRDWRIGPPRPGACRRSWVCSTILKGAKRAKTSGASSAAKPRKRRCACGICRLRSRTAPKWSRMRRWRSPRASGSWLPANPVPARARWFARSPAFGLGARAKSRSQAAPNCCSCPSAPMSRWALCEELQPAKSKSVAAVAKAFRLVGLDHLTEQIDEEGPWDQTLSGGEKQRLPFSRILLHRPEIIVLDEAASALDPASQDKLMELLTKELDATTIVSVGHRPELEAFHNRKIILERRSGGAKFVTDIRLRRRRLLRKWHRPRQRAASS